jgi:hypothetical protein
MKEFLALGRGGFIFWGAKYIYNRLLCVSSTFCACFSFVF